MKRIYKLTWHGADWSDQTFTVPGSTKVLDIQMQNGNPALWYSFDNEDLTNKSLTVMTCQTGPNMPQISYSGVQYISTCQVKDIVLHYFYRFHR